MRNFAVSYTHLDVYKRQIGTCVGAVLGTSTTTTFVERASGVTEGGRTGLTAMTTGCLLYTSTEAGHRPPCKAGLFEHRPDADGGNRQGRFRQL